MGNDEPKKIMDSTKEKGEKRGMQSRLTIPPDEKRRSQEVKG